MVLETLKIGNQITYEPKKSRFVSQNQIKYTANVSSQYRQCGDKENITNKKHEVCYFWF